MSRTETRVLTRIGALSLPVDDWQPDMTAALCGYSEVMSGAVH